jgi:hypothetical protein
MSQIVWRLYVKVDYGGEEHIALFAEKPRRKQLHQQLLGHLPWLTPKEEDHVIENLLASEEAELYSKRVCLQEEVLR